MIELSKIEFDPVCISDGLIYQLINNSQSSRSRILAYPLDSSKTIEYLKRINL